MLVGYNTNISYKGTVYHVQTEDSGLRNPHIITLLYNKGTILARKKIGYASIASAPDMREKVREMMKDQHKSMMKELIAGKHTQDPATSQPSPEPPGGEVCQPEAEKGQPAGHEIKSKSQISRSLDDVLLDHIMKEENN
jgi:hypothetical protein